jgi:hypothetical protein
MYLPEPVSPSEAEVVWASIPNPSARRVARALSQAGRHVHHSTVARWRAGGWRTAASGLHPLRAARQALDVAVTVLTGDPIAGANPRDRRGEAAEGAALAVRNRPSVGHHTHALFADDVEREVSNSFALMWCTT